MGDSQPTDLHEQIVRHRDQRLRVWGLRSWYVVGITAAGAIVYTGLAAISGLVIPLIVATVVAMLFAPLTDFLERLMPRALAAGVVLVGLLAISIGAFAVAVAGVVDQAPEIGARLSDGIEQVGDWFDEQGWTSDDADSLVDDLGDVWGSAVPGATTYLSSVFSSAAAFAGGSLVAVFLLYFGLKDWRELSEWLSAHMGVSSELGTDITAEATWSIRQYFIALTISSLAVAVVVGVAVAILGLPLAFTIAVVTFATSYVPYLGAILSGAFAVLIALGSGGFADALIVLVVVLVAQNVIQTIVQTKLTEGRLKMHPIVIFGSTIAGGALFGLLGAALSTSVVAIAVRISRRLDSEPPSPASVSVEPAS